MHPISGSLSHPCSIGSAIRSSALTNASPTSAARLGIRDARSAGVQASLKAEGILNTCPEAQVGRSLGDYGEQRGWTHRARKTVQARLAGGIHTTSGRVDAIKRSSFSISVPSTEATAEVIDGKKIAEDIRREIAQEVSRMKEAVGQVPGLAVVLVGNRVDSATYVRSKKKACAEVGIGSYGVDLPEDATEQEVLSWVSKYNDDPAVHGILVQLPLPKHMNEEKVIGAISVEKDVDGFHPLNVGRLVLQGRTPLFVSCTPKGCIELLLRSRVQIAGKHAVVIGRSNVVGMPAAILLQAHNATVTVVHSRTPNPAEITRTADIVIAAVGVAQLVRGDWIKPGAVVIDVGMNSLEDPSKKKGYRLVGDVCYQEVAKVASKITPVPGGVGPMTIAMLLQNTLDSAKRTLKL